MRRTISLQIPHIQDPDHLPEEIRWVVRGGDSPEGLVYRGDWQTAANHAVGCRVEVLLAASQVLLTEVRLPAMNRQRLAKAIPFALEEQLATDVDNLHFAVGPRISEESVACEVTERDVLQAVLDSLKALGVQADQVSSEIFALPYEDAAWTVWLAQAEDGSCRALLRTGPQAAVDIDPENLITVLSYALEALEHDKRPTRLIVLHSLDKYDAMSVEPRVDEAEIASTESASPAVKSLQDELQTLCTEFALDAELRRLDQASLASMVQSLDPANRLDLLQGEFSRKEQVEKLLRPWIPAAAMLLVWVCVQLGMATVDYMALKEQDVALRAEIEAVFRSAVPDEKTISDPKLQMERELRKLKSGNKGSADMLTLMSKAGEVLQATSGMTLNGLRYKDAQLDVDLHINDLQALDQLKSRLIKEAKLAVEIVSASARDGKVESRLKIQLDEQQAG